MQSEIQIFCYVVKRIFETVNFILYQSVRRKERMNEQFPFSIAWNNKHCELRRNFIRRENTTISKNINM